MQDSITRETGNSRYLRTVAGIKQVCPDYDSFLTLLVKGEFPIDFAGINTVGWAQMGTALNKANLLTDATAALVDLGPEATPNEMLAALANAVNTANSTAKSAQSTASASSSGLTALSTKVSGIITKGTADMTAGSTSLEDGVIYAMYE